MDDSIFVGLDVHKATVAVAVAEGMRGGEVRHLGTIPNRADHIAKLAEKLAKGGQRLSFCYEAGPCGYGLHRQLTALGHECMVVTPSLLPMKAGDRVKTDRRDAIMLAKLHRAGELTAGWERWPCCPRRRYPGSGWGTRRAEVHPILLPAASPHLRGRRLCWTKA